MSDKDGQGFLLFQKRLSRGRFGWWPPTGAQATVGLEAHQLQSLWNGNHLGPRDRFIGWSAPQRRAKLHLLAYNTRYLLMPWVKVPHLASHLLARVARQIAADWQALYGHPVYLLETFIDPERFRWFPDTPSFEMLDKHIAEGYDRRDTAEAVRLG